MFAQAVWMAIVAAVPGWKVDIDHREDVRDVAAKKNSTLDTVTQMKEVFTLTATEEGPSRPKAVELKQVRGTLGTVTARDERGEAVVHFEHPLQDERLGGGMRKYFARLVADDAYRPAMSRCDAESAAAAEKWLRKNLAEVLLSTLEDLTLDKLSLRCSQAKAVTSYDVTTGVNAPRGRSWVKLTLKGRITVDPAVWATTWKIAGPITLVVDMGAFGAPKLAGTFSSSFSLTKK